MRSIERQPLTIATIASRRQGVGGNFSVSDRSTQEVIAFADPVEKSELGDSSHSRPATPG